MRRLAAALVGLALALPGCKGKGKGRAAPPVDARAAPAAGDAGADGGLGAGSGDKLDAIAQAEDARAAGAVLPYLRDPDPAVRALAARALGRVADAKTFESLRALLDDPTVAVRSAVAEALAIAGDEQAGPALVRRFNLEKTPDVQAVILRALGLTGGDEGPPVLEGALHDADPSVRGAAALGLASYGVRKKPLPVSSLAELAKLLGDRDQEVVFAATYALFRAKARGPAPPAGDGGVPPAPAVIPAPLDPAVVARLLPSAEHPVADDMALRALAAHKALSLKVAAQQLPRQSWMARVSLVRGLFERPDKELPAAIKALHAALATAKLDTTDAHVAIAGLEAAGAHAQVPGVALELRATARDLARLTANRPDAAIPVRRRLAHVRCAAAAALARAGDFDSLAKCDPGLVLGTLPRRMLAEALGEGAEKLHLPEVDQRLRALGTLAKDKDATVRAAAAGAAGAFADPRAQGIVRDRLAEDDAGVASAAADAAKTAATEGKRPDLAALDRLLTIATKQRAPDWVEARLSAVNALAAFPKGIPSIDEGLRTALKDPASEVVRHALEALAKRGTPVADAVVPHPDPAPVPGLPRGAKVTADIALEGGGELHCKLDHDLAPRTVDSFVALARKGFYDGLTWHRVVPDFVVQGGDPRGDGTGGPGYLLRAEPSLRPFARGALGIADAGKDTGGSQFFLMHSRAPHLEGRYTWFGQCEDLDGLDGVFVGDHMTKVTVHVR